MFISKQFFAQDLKNKFINAEEKEQLSNQKFIELLLFTKQVKLQKDNINLIVQTNDKQNKNFICFLCRTGTIKIIRALPLQGSINNFQFINNYQFICANNNNIIICEQGKNTNWEIVNILSGHLTTNFILEINEKKNLIVSGEHFKYIKFWSKQNDWFCIQTVIEQTSRIEKIYFNLAGEKLIIFYVGFLSILQKENTENWILIIN